MPVCRCVYMIACAQACQMLALHHNLLSQQQENKLTGDR